MSTRRRPTDAELDILRVLWTHGPSTVREITTTLGCFLKEPPAAHTVREFAQRFSWDEPVARLVERLR